MGARRLCLAILSNHLINQVRQGGVGASFLAVALIFNELKALHDLPESRAFGDRRTAVEKPVRSRLWQQWKGEPTRRGFPVAPK